VHLDANVVSCPRLPLPYLTPTKGGRLLSLCLFFSGLHRFARLSHPHAKIPTGLPGPYIPIFTSLPPGGGNRHLSSFRDRTFAGSSMSLRSRCLRALCLAMRFCVAGSRTYTTTPSSFPTAGGRAMFLSPLIFRPSGVISGLVTIRGKERKCSSAHLNLKENSIMRSQRHEIRS
jgi:hypothetical protein